MVQRKKEGYVMISVISERYNIHPQTLRLYEREGLLRPERTGGNTRLYGPDAIRRLEVILSLTRDLGVNLAGVEFILNLQREMMNDAVDSDTETILSYIRQLLLDRRAGFDRKDALVKAPRRDIEKSRR
ncbi:MAG TPA: MerR family transcriptional regulator [Thermoanaerobaculia bacterium]|nr:MerR family transcriptional regulator [Thermoanaerobaculia bacterium]